MTISIYSAPNWVPKEKAKAYDRMLTDLDRLAGILDSKSELVDCVAMNDYFIVQFKRHDLLSSQIINYKIHSCSVDSGVVDINFNEMQSVSYRLKKNSDLVTASYLFGLLTGILLSLM